jgi:hypothetical protein
MKKITILAVALVAISFASCKKDRTCTCKTVITPASGAAVTVESETTVKEARKYDATVGACGSSSYQETAPVAGTKTETTCELK